MKLWKLNAVLIVFMIGVCVNTEIKKMESEDRELNLFDLDDVYVENDKYIDQIESKMNSKPILENKAKTFDESKNFLEISRLTPQSNIQNKPNNLPKNGNPKSDPKQPKKAPIDNKKIEKKTSKVKIVMERNPKITYDKAFMQKYVTYKKCIHKTGILGLVKNVSPSILEPSLINATPIFVTLNKQTISFFSSTKSISLFRNIKLDSILRLTQRLPKTFCFDIVENEVREKVLLKGPLSLCASTESEMLDWIDAIEVFKECNVNVNPMQNNKKILADFQKVNVLTQDVKRKQSGEQLYYNNDKSIKPSPKRIAKEMQVENELKNIINIVKLGNLAQNQVKRKMINKLKEVEQFSRDVRKKQNLIQEIVRKRMEEEQESDTRLITIEHKAKELQLLKAVQDRIKQLKLKEMKDYKNVLEDRIKEMKEKANDEAKNMMRVLMNQNKFEDFRSCVDLKLYKFKNKDYVSKLCFQYYGEFGHSQCEIKREFCNQCCTHHVGIKFASKLFECKTKCTKIVNGIEIPEVKEKSGKSVSVKKNEFEDNSKEKNESKNHKKKHKEDNI